MVMRIFLEEKLDLTPRACLHNRYKDYPEHPCLSACPHKAITLDPLKINLDLCDDCGICASVCPTDALSIKEGYFRKILEPAARAERNKINIKCSRVNEYCTEVSCLGALDQVLLAELCLRTEKNIGLFAGNCGDCDKAPGGSIARSNIEAANNLLFLYGRKEKISIVEPETHDLEADNSKRAIFKSIGTAISKFIPEIQNNLEPLYPPPVPRKRQRLLGLIKKLGMESKIKADCALPFKGKRIDGLLCDNCGGSIKCVKYCPSNALAFSITEESGAAITFEAGKCIGCDICEIACPKKALDSFALRSTRIEELWSEKKLVRLFEVQRCGQCGKCSLNAQDGLCPDCIQRERKLNGIERPKNN